MSNDGGRTWAPADEPTRGQPDRQPQACTSGGSCFRAVGGERVEERVGGEWATAFQYSEKEARRLDLRNRGCGQVSPDRDLYRSVTVLDVEGDDYVIVAMETQGVLHRSPDGDWERVAVLDLKPSPLWGPSWLSSLRWAPLVLVALAPLALIVGLLLRRVREVAFFATIFIVAGAVIPFGSGVVLIFLGPIADYAIFGPVLMVMSLVVFIFSVAAFRRGKLWPASTR